MAYMRGICTAPARFMHAQRALQAGPVCSEFDERVIMKATKLRFRTRGYVSDFEGYLDQFKQQHPHVEQDQQRGWDIWWDHRPLQEELTVRRADAVPVRGYQYQ
jgi:hypothetical protein